MARAGLEMSSAPRWAKSAAPATGQFVAAGALGTEMAASRSPVQPLGCIGAPAV